MLLAATAEMDRETGRRADGEGAEQTGNGSGSGSGNGSGNGGNGGK